MFLNEGAALCAESLSVEMRMNTCGSNISTVLHFTPHVLYDPNNERHASLHNSYESRYEYKGKIKQRNPYKGLPDEDSLWFYRVCFLS